MKKLIALFLVAVMALSSLVGCGATENEDDKMSIMSLSYTSVDYFGGYTEEYYFDFEKNILTKHSFFPGDEESDNTETLAEFTDEEKAEAIYLVMNMATHNFITKADFLNVIKWLWNRFYEYVEVEE